MSFHVKSTKDKSYHYTKIKGIDAKVYRKQKAKEDRDRHKPIAMLRVPRSSLPLICRIPPGIVEAVKQERTSKKTPILALACRYGLSCGMVRCIINDMKITTLNGKRLDLDM